MKERSAVLPMIVFGATLSYASAALQTPPTTEPAAEQAAAAQLRGEVVTVDREAKILRIKAQAEATDLGELALNVQQDAEAALADVKAGDVVAVTCREGTSRAECVVVAIERVPSN
jgi:Cu/Ag efflux protein CusF